MRPCRSPVPAEIPIDTKGLQGAARAPENFVKSLNPLDLYDVRSLLSEEEQLVQDTTARFVDEKVLPIIGECFEQARFPK